MVTARRAPLFRDFGIAVEAARQLRALQRAGDVELLAWVIMPDHVHALVVPRRANLSQSMRLFKGRTARAAGCPGFWQRGFHDHALRREESLLKAARYVVANPLRAGLVRRLADYPFWDCAWL